jgi:hypothetical protein
MSTMQILDEQLGRIATGNRQYAYNRTTWHYLLESYLGGEDFKRGQHLTRYQLETDAEYGARIRSTPLENHCKAIINVYNSFLFKAEPEREFGTMPADMPELMSFLNDADMEGRSLDAFMKDVSTWASVFGHCWVLVAKPNIGAVTKADEMSAGVRPYLVLLNPLSVLDWRWERDASGYYDLKRLKYIEDINGSIQTIKEWTTDSITTWIVDYDNRKLINETIEVNELGSIPAVDVYSARSAVRGVGVSDIADIADLQKSIYNMLSEVEQTIRMDGHPSLVKTPETQAGTGAGSIISIPENLDPGLTPYLLEYNGASLDSIYKAIDSARVAINDMSNTGGIRSTVTKTMSGIAMQTEFQLLNAKIAEKADNLELAEEQIWEIWAKYQGYEWDGCVDYPNDYSIQDEQQQYVNLQVAKTAASGPEAMAVIDQMLIDLVTDDTPLEGLVKVALSPVTTSDIAEETVATTGPKQSVIQNAAAKTVSGSGITNGFAGATNNQGK